MGYKVTARRGWGKKTGEGSSRRGNSGKRKRGHTVGEELQSESNGKRLEELPLVPSDAQRRKEKAKKDRAK